MIETLIVESRKYNRQYNIIKEDYDLIHLLLFFCCCIVMKMLQTLSLSLLIITTATEAYSFVPRTSSRQGSILEHVRVLPRVNRKHNYSRNKEGLLEMKGCVIEMERT